VVLIRLSPGSRQQAGERKRDVGKSRERTGGGLGFWEGEVARSVVTTVEVDSRAIVENGGAVVFPGPKIEHLHVLFLLILETVK